LHSGIYSKKGLVTLVNIGTFKRKYNLKMGFQFYIPDSHFMLMNILLIIFSNQFFWVTTAHSLIGKVFFFSHQKILRKEKHLRLHLNIFFLARSLAKVRKTEDNRHRKKWEEDWLLDRWNVLAKRNGLWPKNTEYESLESTKH
jgi:hypothetical protein